MTRIIKYLLYSLTIYFCQSTLFAQQSKTDSLLTLLKTDKPDTTKVNHLNDLGWQLMDDNPDTAIILSNQASTLAEKLQWEKGIANSLGNLGVYYWFKSDYSRALDCSFKALNIAEELGNKKGIARNLTNIGNVYKDQGDYPKTLDYYFKALKMAEERRNKQSQATIFCNIGIVYDLQKDYPKALYYDFKALKIDEKLGNQHSIAGTLCNIGAVYYGQKNYPKALDYFCKALKINEELGDNNWIATNLGNMGAVYYDQKDYSKALDYDFKALKINEELGDKKGVAINLGNIGSLYTATKKYVEAEKYLLEALRLDKAIGATNDERQMEELLTDLYEKTGREKLALEHYRKAMLLKDTIFNIDKDKAITRKEMNYQFEKKEMAAKAEQDKKNAVAAAEKKKEKVIRYSVIGGLVLMFIIAVIIFRSLRVTRKQKHIIEVKSNETEQQKKIIEEKNKDITDSITYAKRIQRAMLPHRKDIWAAFPQSFVLFKPKDIVSGDFYFFHKNNQSNFIATADCTGHGVPGAFMSMIGAGKLNDAVSQSSDTSEILKLLNIGIKTALKQTDGNESTRDGMDIALCSVDTENRIVNYAGANRPLWIIRNGTNEVEEIKATKTAIGGLTDDNQHFDTHEIKLLLGDTIYISTDGFADQFSGHSGKKLMTKKFKEILLNIQDKSMKEQEQYLDSFIENWKAGTEQVDDVLVIGVRL